jgi:uncharacterized protein (DUF362 family)
MPAPDQPAPPEALAEVIANAIDRRQFLKLLGTSTLAALLSGCRPRTVPAPTPAFTSFSTPDPSATSTQTLAPTAAQAEPSATEAPTSTPTPSPRATVAIERASRYERSELHPAMERLLEGTGGLENLIRPGARVGIKVNLTGGTWWDSPQKPPSNELFATHPAVVAILGEFLLDAGAGRLTIFDGLGDERNFDAWGYTGAAQRLNASLVDLCRPDPYPDFIQLPVKPHPFVYGSFTLNRALAELDVLVSVAKMKVHSISGVTLALKNMIGIAPIRLYRRREQDNHRSEFHESTTFDRRLPRVVLDLCQACPIHLAVIDGVLTADGGAGPWDAGLSQVKPGLLVASKDPVAADAAGAALMGFDPAAPDGSRPFEKCDNYLALAAETGLGVHRLEEIGIAGSAIEEVKFPFKGFG